MLVLSGSMGSGKTTVMAEASDLLIEEGIPHAALDTDGLGVVHLANAATGDLAFRNLAAVWANYAAAGVRRLLLAEALESAARRERLREAVPGAEIVVCRLRAPLQTMQQRVRLREPGMLQETFAARVAALEKVLDSVQVEDFLVDNGDRNVTEVAREVLVRAGWLVQPAIGR